MEEEAEGKKTAREDDTDTRSNDQTIHLTLGMVLKRENNKIFLKLFFLLLRFVLCVLETQVREFCVPDGKQKKFLIVFNFLENVIKVLLLSHLSLHFSRSARGSKSWTVWGIEMQVNLENKKNVHCQMSSIIINSHSPWFLISKKRNQMTINHQHETENKKKTIQSLTDHLF